ncbi:MAG: glycosyltransferase family 2 protein [Methanotrichaceae archaeon]|nr:glycosyltransferase family 2 protein [Methanotrichaceae archaeon]
MALTIAALPAYNEERSIAKIIMGCRRYVDKIVVVDDGSSDSTGDIAKALGAIVVRHEKNLGYGAAIRSCFQAARELGADQMVILDADGQHNPEDIPSLLKPLRDGVHIVIGSRFCNGNGQYIPFYRKLGLRILDVATNFVGNLDISDSQSGFRAYGTKAIEKIKISHDGMSAGTEILFQAKDYNFFVSEVEINCRYDVENPSKENPLSHGAKVLWIILNDMESRRPLYYFTFPGIALMAIGLTLGIELIGIFYRYGSLPFGPTLLMIFLSIVGSFMALSGIILHSISRTNRDKFL